MLHNLEKKGNKYKTNSKMNFYIFFLISIIILISPTNSGLTEEQRKSLKKVTKFSFTN